MEREREVCADMRNRIGKFKSVFLLGLLMLVLCGCGRENLTALVPNGYGADSSMYLIILTTVVMSFLFIPVMIVYVLVSIRFRKKKGDERSEERRAGKESGR